MAYDGYLCLDGIQLVSQQAVAYACQGWAPDTATVRDCCVCPGLDAVLGHPDGWQTPAIDAAPWYDPTEPDSYDFGGVIIQEVTGLGPGRLERAVNELAAGGAVLGRVRQAPPVITVTGILMGRTGCAISYGLRWLRTALRGSCSPGTRCAGADLRYLECCPPPLDPDCPDIDYDAHFAPYWRTLKRVSLVSDVEIIERIGKRCSCGCGMTPMVRVQFAFAAGRPCAYREQVTLHDSVPLAGGDTWENCFTWVRVDGGEECPPDEETCTIPDPCAFDPGCPTPPPPPPVPVPLNSCITCTPFEQARICLDVPPDVVPGWAQGVIGMSIYAGSLPLRHVRARFWENPLGLPVDQLDPCAACSELNVAYIPAWGTFELDGAEQITTIKCPGAAPAPAAPVLGGPPGRLFSYPVLECGGLAYTVCVDVDGASVALDATVSLSATVREC